MPNPVFTVKEHGKAKSGRPFIVTTKGDKYYLSNDCREVPPIGATIEAETRDGSFTNPKGERVEMWYLNAYCLADQQLPQPEVKAIQQQAVVSASANDRFREDEAVLRFVSNAIGQALAAGQIKTPDQIASWVAAAHRAGLNVIQRKEPKDFDDKIPF